MNYYQGFFKNIFLNLDIYRVFFQGQKALEKLIFLRTRNKKSYKQAFLEHFFKDQEEILNKKFFSRPFGFSFFAFLRTVGLRSINFLKNNISSSRFPIGLNLKKIFFFLDQPQKLGWTFFFEKNLVGQFFLYIYILGFWEQISFLSKF